MTPISRGARLRAMLQNNDANQVAVAPGCYDGISAKLVEAAGFPAAYMSGLCVAATMGEPDVGVLSVDTMVDRARLIAASIDIPLIVDADTGYGGAYNVARATRAFESSGAAAMHLEDQPFPKKCAAMAGKSLVSIPEMVARLRVAVAARTNPDFLILARTDAFAVEGLDSAIERLKAYEQAGVDGTILMSVATEKDMLQITGSLRKPTIVNMVEGLRPLVPLKRLREIGYPLVCYPVSLLQAQVHAQRRMLQALARDGTTSAVADTSVTLSDINGVLALGNAHQVDDAYTRYLAKPLRPMERENVGAMPRWSRRPEGANWGDYGTDDQRGRLNLITADCVKAAVAEVVEGRVFCLSLPLDYPGGTALNPNRHPPVLRPTLRAGKVNYNCRPGGDRGTRPDVLCDDLAVLHLQYSTQWDSLAHVGAMFDVHGDGRPKRVYYNGYQADTHVEGPDSDDTVSAGWLGAGPALSPRSTCGAHALGIENIAQTCVQGRGVMADLRAHLGEGRTLVRYSDLVGILERDGVVVERGDILCLHTGFAEMLMAARGLPNAQTLHEYGAVLDGTDAELLRWITDSGISAIAADNYAVESYPANTPEDCSALPLHHHCLFKLGLPLGELWRLSPLAQHLRERGRFRFLLTAPPLYLRGAVGSPVTPVATV